MCKSQECLNKAYKTKRLSRNLEVQISEDIYNRLKEEMNDE